MRILARSVREEPDPFLKQSTLTDNASRKHTSSDLAYSSMKCVDLQLFIPQWLSLYVRENRELHLQWSHLQMLSLGLVSGMDLF